MNLSPRKNRINLMLGFAALVLAALALLPGRLISEALAAAAKLDVEVPYEIKALKTAGIAAPSYLAAESGDSMVVSDAAGGVYSVTMSGKATPLAGKDKVKHPGGVAIAPAGFGSYGGQVFVLASSDEKAPCEVERIDKSGAVSTFAKLADNGSLNGGKPTGCRDLAFAPSGPYAGKLYAATTENATIYAIDSSGKASVFGTYDKPLQLELTTIYFAPATDGKAPGMMLVGMRPSMAGAAKVGRIGVVTPDGKLKDDPYLVGFIRPGGFGYAPGNFGAYSGQLFVVDTGRWAGENSALRDGTVYRVDKGIARPYGGGMVDPTDMKFVGNKMVLCDPAEKGKPGDGAIVVITSLL